MTTLAEVLVEVVGRDHVLDDPDVTASYVRGLDGPLHR